MAVMRHLPVARLALAVAQAISAKPSVAVLPPVRAVCTMRVAPAGTLPVVVPTPFFIRRTPARRLGCGGVMGVTGVTGVTGDGAATGVMGADGPDAAVRQALRLACAVNV